MLIPGQEVDRYEVLGPIATGGMAEVFKVRHTSLGTEHALKVLVLRTQDIKRRMLQEGRMQAALKHKNAVSVTDVIDVDGHPGLVMEYVDGPTLLNWRYDEAPDFKTIEQVYRDIIAGVAAAHGLGLVHRDLKPSNILIDGAQGAWVPKVCDFGLAKALTDQQTEDATRSGVPMGTPSYMAPEQIADAKSVDLRADIFSLGALLYYMCTGRKAFDGKNAVETYNAVLDGEYLPASHHNPEIPSHLLAAIEACLRVDPTVRCADTQALLEILDGGAPVAAASVAAAPVEAVAPQWMRWMIPAGLLGFLTGCFALVLVVRLQGSVGLEPIETDPPSAHEVGAILEPTRAELAPEMAARVCAVTKGLHGYLPLPSRMKKGAVFTLPQNTSLRSTPDGPKNGCILPKGSKVEAVSRASKKGKRFWVEVSPANLRLPR